MKWCDFIKWVRMYCQGKKQTIMWKTDMNDITCLSVQHQVAVLVLNYGISKTIVLEIPPWR